MVMGLDESGLLLAQFIHKVPGCISILAAILTTMGNECLSSTWELDVSGGEDYLSKGVTLELHFEEGE